MAIKIQDVVNAQAPIDDLLQQLHQDRELADVTNHAAQRMVWYVNVIRGGPQAYCTMTDINGHSTTGILIRKPEHGVAIRKYVAGYGFKLVEDARRVDHYEVVPA